MELTANTQLERTVIRHHVRAACASFHCAHAARRTRDRAAAELRRYAPLDRRGAVPARMAFSAVRVGQGQ
jgi:multidrug resistance efflux pump